MLLGALNATTIAGPAAIISWGIGAAAVMLLAFEHAELGGMSPVGGGNARFPHFAFGSLVGSGMGWVYWLGAVTLAPWLIGLGVISYLASFDGGKSTLHFGADMAVCAVFSLGIYYLALRLRLPPQRTKHYFDETADEAAA